MTTALLLMILVAVIGAAVALIPSKASPLGLPTYTAAMIWVLYLALHLKL